MDEFNFDDPMYDDIKAYITDRLDHALEMFEFMWVHTIIWGEPYGPTLNRVPVPDPISAFDRYLKGNV